MALEHEIAQFGQRMGFANLPLSPDGTVALEIEGMGRLYLEQRPEELLLYLARPVPPHDRDMPRRILALCHYGKAHSFLLSGGMHKGQAILLTRMPERGVTTAFLENAATYLAQQMDSIFRN